MQPIDSNFSVPPFPAFPSVSRYVPLGSIDEAVQRVRRSIDAREGIALVLGPPGTGKSLVCNVLAEQYRSSHDVVVLGETPIADGTAFRRHLLHHLGVDVNSIPNNDLHLALTDYVCGNNASAGGLLILIDEAQLLSPETIESIRLTTNIMKAGQPRVFTVLCGNVSLEETLVASSMEAFNQRIATRCYLHPMNSDETRLYISETIRGCDADPENTITNEAIAAVHHACLGVPRLINQIMTEAIDCAAEADVVLIDETMIDRAWARLQQLPSPMVEEPKLTAQGTPVEFGELTCGEADNSIGDDLEIVGANEFDCCQIESAETAGLTSAAMNAQEACSPEDSTPARETVPEATHVAPISPADLFGVFETEEEVAVGTKTSSSQQTSDPHPAAEIETVLHQEIIGMSEMAAGSLQAYDVSNVNPIEETGQADLDELEGEPEMFYGDESTNGPTEIMADSIEEPEPAQPAADERPDLCIATSASDSEASDLQETSIRDQPRVWPADDESDDASSVGRDDSDLLVIEDEVQLTRVDDIKRVDAREQTISVDFQAMLSRMRSSH